MQSSSADNDPTRVTMFVRHPVSGWHSVEELFTTVRHHLPPDISVSLVVLAHPSRGLIPRLRNMLQARRARGDVNHITGDVHYIALALPRNRTVLTILDLGGLSTTFGLRRRLLEYVWYRLPVFWVRSITVISEFTRAELVNLIPRASAKTTVIENPLAPAFSPENNPQLNSDQVEAGDSILCIGTTANKNLARSIEATRRLGARLTIVGKLDVDALNFDDDNRWLTNRSNLSQADLIDIYRSSSLLLFPSLYEGFGMPIIEAQALGLPVVTSDREPMRSIAGGAALLVDPESVDDLCDAIECLQSDDRLRQSLIRLGRSNIRRFQPDGVAERYAEIYRDIRRSAGR